MIPSSDVLSPLILGDSKDSVHSPDAFLRRFYRFYCNKGLLSTLLSEVCAVMSLGFAIAFSVYLFEFVDWEAVTKCSDEETCQMLNDHFASNPFHHTPKFTSFLSALYFLLFLCVWIWRAWRAIKIFQQASEMSSFYRDRLNISDGEIETMEWPTVLEKLLYAHRAGHVQIVSSSDMTVHDVVLRIMRSENYMIALVNRNCLHMFLPWWMTPFFTESVLFTKSMEWSISYCVLAHLFDDDYRLSTEFLEDVDSLKFRFQVVGLLQLIMLPFTFIFVIVYFLMENFQQFHSNRAYLGPRQWTPLARWEFREFNELPHLFEQRLNRAYDPALQYLNSFSNISIAIVAEFVAFVSGAFVAVLVLVSFISEGGLLYIHIAERNLLWYLGIFSACFAASRTCIPDSTKTRVSAADLLAQASAMTHHFPPHWQNQEHSKAVRDEMSYLLQHKIVIFLFEILGVLLTPIILIVSLPASAATIVDFVKKHSRILDGMGAVCDYSLLELERYGDYAYGSVPVHNNTQMHTNERLNSGKLEKSYLNFQQTYASLVPPGKGSGRPFQENLSSYKEIKRDAKANLLASILEVPSRQGQDIRNRHYHSYNQQMQSQSSVESDVSVEEENNNYKNNNNHNNHNNARNNSNMVTSTFYDAHEQKKRDTADDSGVAMTGGLHSPEIRTMKFPKLDSSSSPPRTTTMLNRGASSFYASTTATSHYPRPSQQQQQQQDLFTSSIPNNLSYTGLLGNSDAHGSSNGGDLPDILLSVLREQNIDYRNDFYWLNRFHYDNRQHPAELQRSLMQHRNLRMSSIQQQQQRPRAAAELSHSSSSSSVIQQSQDHHVPQLNLPNGNGPPSYTNNNQQQQQQYSMMSSPTFPGFHLSGTHDRNDNNHNHTIGGVQSPAGDGGGEQPSGNIFMPPTWSPPSSVEKMPRYNHHHHHHNNNNG